MTETTRTKKLIEVALPLDEINAACKAEKDRKKAKKAAEKGLAGVETAEKGGVQTEAKAGEAIEEVAEGVKQVSLQTS